MSFLKRLFGGGKEPPQGEEYKGFMIYAEPLSVPGGYRVNALIEKDGREHDMIRADVVASEDEARQTTILKAKALIDQQGETIF